jgi:pantoate--beta-alanine ligase
LAIVREMVKQLQIPVEIVAVPIVREESGLALSSRNMRLTPQQRETASEIFKTLKMSVDMISKQSVEDTEKFVVDRINNHEALSVEYFEIVDGNTLQSITDWNDSPYVVGCIAVFCGEVRLIDNIRYK